MTPPRTIHRLWLGGPEPDWTTGFADTWRQPGWEVRQWTDDNVGELFPLVNQDLYDRAEEIAGSRALQFRSDVLRYEILHRFGGVWVDADFECVRPINDLLDGVDCFAAWVTDRWLNNAIMGAVPGHPFIGRLVDGLAESVSAGGKPNVVSGPQYLTRIYGEHPEGVTTLAKEHFYPYIWSELDRGAEHFPDARAIHHWGNQRRERSKPLARGPRKRPWPAFWKRYRAGLWEPETKAWLQANLGPGDLFLDIGAWIGPVTLWALECGAEVIAIEPDPLAASELRRVVPCEVEVWEGAVTVDGGSAFLAAKHELGDSMSRLATDGVAVKSWTLPEILDGRVPKLAKMDIEGYELELLPTVGPYLANLGVPLQVALHDGLPDPASLAGYPVVDMPDAARDRRGRSNVVTAGF